MRPVRIIATTVLVAALALTGCTSRSADQPTAPLSSGPASVTTTHPTAASTGTTTTTAASPANATCAVAPNTGLAGSRVTLSCRGFAPSEQVDISFGAEVLTTTKATASGEVASSFAVPSGFAGSHYPGRKNTFRAKGHQSGTAASATFTVTG
jgi:large repetitive protein